MFKKLIYLTCLFLLVSLTVNNASAELLAGGSLMETLLILQVMAMLLPQRVVRALWMVC